MNNIKDYWSELNPKELNDIINLFIKQKIYSPQKMRELYNQAINNSSSSRPQNISKYNKFDIGGPVDLNTTGSSKVLYSEDSENDNSNNNFIIKQALKIANEMLESNSISDNQKNRLLEFAMRISGGNADSNAINKASKYILSKYGRKALFQVLNTNDSVSNIIDKSIEESKYKVGNNYTGLAFLGDVWDKDSFLWNNKNSSDFIDTYIRGDIPFESAGVIKIDDKDENRLGRYSKYIEKNYPDRSINTYQAYRDTLDSNLVKYLDKASTALETSTFGANADNYDIDKSMFPFGTEDNRGFFDAAGYNIELMMGPDGKVYGRKSDIYDFLPSDFNNKWADNNKMHNIVEKINNFGNPFIFRTPWFKASDENIPEEVLSKYADKNKKSLGGRINLSNNNIFEEGGSVDLGNIDSSRVLYVGDSRKEAKKLAREEPYLNTGVSSEAINKDELQLLGKKRFVNTFKRNLEREEKRRDKALLEINLSNKLKNNTITPKEFGQYIAIQRDKTAPYIAGAMVGSMALASGLGSIGALMDAGLFGYGVDAAKAFMNIYNPEAYSTAGLNIARSVAGKLGEGALASVNSVAPTINALGRAAGMGAGAYFGVEGIKDMPNRFNQYYNIYNNDELNEYQKLLNYTGNTALLGLDAFGTTGFYYPAQSLVNSAPEVKNAATNINRYLKNKKVLFDKKKNALQRSRNLERSIMDNIDYYNQYISDINKYYRNNYINTSAVKVGNIEGSKYDYLEEPVLYESVNSDTPTSGVFKYAGQKSDYKFSLGDDIYRPYKIGILRSSNSPSFIIEGDESIRRQIQRDNDYITNLMQGNGVIAGSRTVYYENSGIPRDTEILTTKSMFDRLSRLIGFKNVRQTSTVFSGDADKIKGKVEIEVIEDGPTKGTSIGTIAQELYMLIDPSGYSKLLRNSAIKNGNISAERKNPLVIPMSPEDLFSVYQSNPKLMRMKTILDNIKSGKGKHNSRVLTIINETPDDISNIVDVLGEGYFGSDFRYEVESAMKNIDFGNIQKNREFLNELDLPQSWASDPNKMRALYKTWRFQQTATTRGVQDINNLSLQEGVERLIQNFGYQQASGIGGNTVQNSKYGGGETYSGNGIMGILYSPLSYNEGSFTSVMDGMNAVKRQNRYNESPIFNSQEQVDIVNDLLGSRLTINSALENINFEITELVKKYIKYNYDKKELQNIIGKVSKELDLPVLRNNKAYTNIDSVNGDVTQGGYVGRLQEDSKYYNFTKSDSDKPIFEPGGLFPNIDGKGSPKTLVSRADYNNKEIKSVIEQFKHKIPELESKFNEIKEDVNSPYDVIQMASQYPEFAFKFDPESGTYTKDIEKWFERAHKFEEDSPKVEWARRMEDILMERSKVNNTKYTNLRRKMNKIDDIKTYSILGPVAGLLGTLGYLGYKNHLDLNTPEQIPFKYKKEFLKLYKKDMQRLANLAYDNKISYKEYNDYIDTIAANFMKQKEEEENNKKD